MAKRRKPSLVKTIKKLAREQRLAREKVVGRARAKSFGGKPTAQELRRMQKNALRRLDNGMGL